MISATVRVGRDSLWLAGARVAAQMLALVSLLLARKLGSAGFGEYAFFTTVIFIGNIVTTCGTDLYLIREIAANNVLDELPSALWLQLLLSALFIVAVVLMVPLLPNQSPPARVALQLYSLTLIPLSFYSVFTTALRGRQYMASYALLNLAGALVQALAVVLFLTVGSGLVELAVLLLIAQTLTTLLAGWLYLRQVGGWSGWGFSWLAVRVIFLASASLGLLGLVGMFYQKTEVLLLSALGGAALTGLYAAALRVVDASKLFHIAALTALYPLMAKPHEQARTLSLAWKSLLVGAFVLSLSLSLMAEPVISLLYGAAFAPAVSALRILAWTLLPYAVNAFLTLTLVAHHRTRRVVGALTVSLIGLALLSLWWIPAYGLAGAAWAALIAETVQAVLLLLEQKQFTAAKTVP